MLKSEFQKKMLKAKEELYKSHYFVCWILTSVFESKNTYPKNSEVVKLYKSIIKGRDDRYSGMFGNVTKKNGKENIRGYSRRQVSLEIFEQVVLSEQLYRKL